MAALRSTKDAARAPDLQIAHRDAKPSAQRAVLLDRTDPLARGANWQQFAREKKISVRLMLGPTHASPQLIKIGEAKPVRAIDDDGIGVWDIEAAFDNRRANQHVDFSGHELGHDGFQFI